jgi:hypothetical protein
VDPRLFHLDLALAVLDDERDHIAYYPDAFSKGSRRLLAGLFPDALIASELDAYAFGLNTVSDGLHVFIPAGARQLREGLAAAGYWPISVDLSELIKGGGGVKCCTQEIRPARNTRATSVGLAPLLPDERVERPAPFRLRASEEDSSFQRDVREEHHIRRAGASS